MTHHTVSQVAKLSGLSVRALRHYDEIGLLRPALLGENGYRYYGRDELLRLQQILFHRELGLPLAAIGKILDAPGFDRVAALKAHRESLAKAAKRYRQLVRTIDDTLASLEGDKAMDDKAIYRGFPPEKQAEHEAWLVERLGEGVNEEIADSKARFGKLSQGDYDGLRAEAEAIEVAMAKALADGLPADSDAVGTLMRRHAAWIGRSWNRTPTADAFAGLGRMYQDHPDFRARYDGRAPGLTDYLAEAMRAFAERELA